MPVGRTGRFRRLSHRIENDLFPPGTEVGFGAISGDQLADLRSRSAAVRGLDPVHVPPPDQEIPCVLVGVTESEAAEKIRRVDALHPQGVLILETDQRGRRLVCLVGKRSSAALVAMRVTEPGAPLFTNRVERAGGYHLLVLTPDPAGSETVFALYELAMRGRGTAGSLPLR